jgi:hypothetical protein
VLQGHAKHNDFQCPAEDYGHSSLITAGESGAFLTCTYSQAGQCAYSTVGPFFVIGFPVYLCIQDGYFSSGDSTCPDTLSLASNQSNIQFVFLLRSSSDRKF